ncbi:uncharacterized protein LOC116196559 isoform X1 [Punica granatum]|nr:uncharacterized protein LOC116196559 isoform X1 [Punica granatum]
MAWRCGSLSRSLMSTARASSSPLRSSPGLSRPVRSPPLSVPRAQSRRFSFASPRSMGELGCTQSFLPLHSVVSAPRLTSHLTVAARACCELSHGTFRRTCQDR